MSYKRILMAVDPVSKAKQDLINQRAQSIAQKSGAALSHLNIHYHYGYSGIGGAIAELVADLPDEDTANTWSTSSAEPSLITNQFADKLNADLVVLGDHTPELFFLYYGEDKALLRNTSHNVLFVKNGQRDYQRILCLVDIEQANRQRLVAEAKAFADEVNAELTLLYVIADYPFTTADHLGPFELITQDAEYADVASQQLQTLGQQFSVAADKQWVRHGGLKDVLLTELQQNNFDLLIMGNQHHHGLRKLAPSTVTNIVHQVECDVLTIYLPEQVASRH